MNVLSPFDGMSCGQIALNRIGIKPDNYFASEIDKWAIKTTQKNYSKTVQMGDVRDVRCGGLPFIDLLIAGTPCQGFSYAGKFLNFKDPRSVLFFEFVRLLEETNPKFFMLENVKMKKESEAEITRILGVDPVEINSTLVSAQNRRRLYWTNIPNVKQPEDREIKLVDILETAPVDPVFMSEKFINRFLGYGKKLTDTTSEKSKILSAREYEKNGRQGDYVACDNYGRPVEFGSHQPIRARKLTPIECERLQNVPDGYTAGVSNTQRYKILGNGWTVDVIAQILRGLNE